MAGDGGSQYNTQGSQFDLSVIGNDDLEQLADKIEGYYRKDSTAKVQLAYNWQRVHLMLDGFQWLVFDSSVATGGLWQRLDVSRQNEFIPRPTTNLMFDVYQTLKSYLIKTKPRSTVYPNTELYQDKMAAKIAELCLEANWAKLKEQSNYEYAASCLVAYGTVFKKSYWDTSELVMSKVPRMTQIPKTDPSTGMVTGMEEVQATDPQTGDPIFDTIPLGDINTDIVEPYRICLDPLASDIHKIRWIMEYSIQPLAWIKEIYGKDPTENPGYTGLAEEVEEEPNLQGSLKRFYQLKHSSGLKQRIEGGTSLGSTEEYLINSAVVKEYYERPSRQYPNGRLVVVANHKVLYAGDSPYVGPELGDWHPYSECRWELVPGRFWGKSPLDAAAELQKRLNSIDSVIVLTRKTMAIPQKLIPTSSGVAPGIWTGRPGQEIHWRDAGGAKPEYLPAQGVHASVFQERAQIVQDMKTITGAVDILKGDAPSPSISAASALEMMYEVGMGKIFPILDRFKYFVEQDQKKQLRIISKFYKEPRPDFIRLLMQKNKELPATAIAKFIGSDLYDNCNVVVEAGSNVTKLQAAKKQELREAAQSGVLNLADPRNRRQYMQDMGIQGYDSDIGPDQKRAEWENAVLDDIQTNPQNMPVVLDWDNHAVHIQTHEQRMKEPSWMELPIETQQAYMNHRQQHEQAMQQQQQIQMMQAAAMGQPPQPAPGSQPPPPMRSQPKGKGNPKAVNEALASDTINAGGPT